jgi:DNA-binding transcriptional LysR family regulator
VTDLRRLQYFVTVAQERNFTRAAERLHVAQPALSRQVRLLEKELGVELLYPTTHEFELSEAGKFLLEHGTALLAEADKLWRSARTYGAGERGEVAVAYGASASYETAPRLLQSLAERHPGITITTAVKSVGEIVAGLSDRTIDVGVVRCPPQISEFETHVVRRDRQGILLRRDHRLAGSATVDVEDLAGETLALHPRAENPGHYDAVVGWCRQHGVEPRVLVRTVSFDLGYSPVVQGQAVAVIGESSRIGLPDELSWLPLSPAVSLEVSLLVRRNRSPAVARLVAAATDVATDLGWL